MSNFVTGVLTRNFAKRKLKISDVEPRGATYSVRIACQEPSFAYALSHDLPARMYSSANVLPMS